MGHDFAEARFELETFGFTVLSSVIPAGEAARLGVLDAADEATGIEYTYDGAYARHVANLPARGRLPPSSTTRPCSRRWRPSSAGTWSSGA